MRASSPGGRLCGTYLTLEPFKEQSDPSHPWAESLPREINKTWFAPFSIPSVKIRVHPWLILFGSGHAGLGIARIILSRFMKSTVSRTNRTAIAAALRCSVVDHFQFFSSAPDIAFASPGELIRENLYY